MRSCAWRALWLQAAVFAFPAFGQGAPPPDGSPASFAFAVLGELPSGARAEEEIANVLRAVDTSSTDFTIDLGNIKSTREPCTDELYAARKDLLDGLRRPVVALPGFNDWVACGQIADAASDPVERLTRLREVFDASNVSLGQETIPVARQSNMRRFHQFAENVRWQYGRIVFVGLNVPGVNNDFRLAAGRNGEFEDRVIANRVWLDRAFRLAEEFKLPGVVVAISGNPEFQRPLRVPDRGANRRDGFYELKIQLRELALQFHGQILLVHNGSGALRGDEPLNDSTGKPLRNLVRAESSGTTPGSHWLKVTVDTRRARIFTTAIEDALPTVPDTGDPGIPVSSPP